MSEIALSKPSVLPPKGLLIALSAQLPIVASSIPLRPTALEVTLGAGLVTAGVILNIWAERLFRRNQVGVCPFTHVPAIVDSGPYRFTRNPMYLGLVCLNLGMTFLSGALPNVWSSVALFIWLHYAFVLPEESFLKREIGEAFDRYAGRIPRWLWR